MTFIEDARIVAEALDRYREESVEGRAPVIRQRPMAEIVEALGLHALIRAGGLTGARLRAFLDDYLAFTTRLHHPAFMGHQVATPHPAGALAAMVDGLTNNAMAIYEMGPAASSIEYVVVNWMLERVGWTPAPVPGTPAPAGVHGGGTLMHGGSLANLTALLAARGAVAPSSWRVGTARELVIIAPAGAHYSVQRAAGIMGLGTDGILHAEVDARGAIRPDRLPALLARARADGRRVLAVVANACSTAVGVYDPLRAIGDFCRAEGLWLHVDGAHGASALLSPRQRHRLDGVELADSLAWDAHKMMRTPTLCAALLVRDRRTLDGAFQQDASYLFHEKEQPGFDFLQRTVECTKAGLGLRLFAVLAAMGETGLAEYVDRQVALAHDAWELMRRTPGVECAVEPESNIVCFRMPGDDDAQLRLRERVIARGEFYITSTMFGGRRHLRLVFMNPDTTLEHVRRLIDHLRGLTAPRP
jgi:L-2,4-diaminobutyrate decarboxylase